MMDVELGELPVIDTDEFLRVDIRVGTVVTARLNPKAKKPAYVLEIDFGNVVGMKTSSAQITDAYSAQDIIGTQVTAVMNFAPKKVAGIRSEVLVLAVVQQDGPTILLHPSDRVANGSRIA